MATCKCGCDAVVTPDERGRLRVFINGHNARRHNQCAHGKFTSEYRTYCSAKDRCVNPKSRSWKNYGGRGIKFLFTSFEQFYTALGPRPSGLTLERIDNDGHYTQENVTWASRSEQQKNRRNLVALMTKASLTRWTT